MDDKDIKIINILKEDSRLSVRDIAASSKLRPSTVHSRIQKLKQEGVIEKFTVKLNNEKVDEGFIVFILIRTNEMIDSKVFKNKAVKEAFGVTGEYDVLLKCKFRDLKEFNEFIMKLRRENNIRRTMTMISTTLIKEEM